MMVLNDNFQSQTQNTDFGENFNSTDEATPMRFSNKSKNHEKSIGE